MLTAWAATSKIKGGGARLFLKNYEPPPPIKIQEVSNECENKDPKTAFESYTAAMKTANVTADKLRAMLNKSVNKRSYIQKIRFHWREM